MRIINGRWTNNQGESLTSPEDQIRFTDLLSRFRPAMQGKKMTHNKIELLFRILDTDDVTDEALKNISLMDKNYIKKFVI